jgi:hypothetical protein
MKVITKLIEMKKYKLMSSNLNLILSKRPPDNINLTKELTIKFQPYRTLLPFLKSPLFTLSFASKAPFKPGWAKRLGPYLRELDDNSSQIHVSVLEAWGLLVGMLNIFKGFTSEDQLGQEWRQRIRNSVDGLTGTDEEIILDTGSFIGHLIDLNYRNIPELAEQLKFLETNLAIDWSK